MFAQVMQGRTRDAEGLERQMDKWMEQQSSGAGGWLGATGGVSDDGEFVTVVRFESEEAARRNSARPEQGQWWAETEKLFEGEPTFHDCTEVDAFLDGGSDDAGFVQVIQGRTDEREAFKSSLPQMEQTLRQHRPDVLGGTIAWHPDGGFTQVVYFTSEADAREGERKDTGEEAQQQREDWQSKVSDIRFIDLRNPWLNSA